MQKFNIPIDSSAFVTDQIIVHKNKEYLVADVSSLELEEYKQSMNFVTTFSQRSLLVKFFDGRAILILCRSPILKRQKYQNIYSAYVALCVITYRQRYERYQKALRSPGYFDYSIARIYADGTISYIDKPDKRLSLHNAHAENRLVMGRSYGVSWIGHSETDPSAIKIFEKPQSGLFSKTECVQFWGSADRDVIIPFLRNLYKTFP